jgi:DnaJ-class molecular chaperone
MVALVLVVIVVVGGYVVSTRIHPLRKCPTCNMSGRHFGSIYRGSYRPCRTCRGSGRRDRVGTKVIWGGTKNTGFYPKK